MNTRKKHIVIFFSDTGGGHRSAAQAIGEAFECDYPNQVEITLVDAFKDATPFPINQTPKTYLPLTTYAEPTWAALFRVSNHPRLGTPSRVIIDWVAGRRMRRVLHKLVPDLVVNVHPIFTTVACRAAHSTRPRTPMVTVVTDLFTAHQLWFDVHADLTIVPTEGARQVGKRAGMSNEKMRVIGLPVSLKFIGDSTSQKDYRANLGLDPRMKTALLVGGGEGMGKLYEIARAIDQARLPVQLAIIAGRNQPLQQKLEQAAWHLPVKIKGFVTNMPDWMRASDVIITKAGPGTISEAIACGLPIILSGFLPGQEEGNVTFVESSQVGVMRRQPDEIARTLGEWLEPGNDILDRLAARAKELARARAALDIAKILHDMLMAHRSD